MFKLSEGGVQSGLGSVWNECWLVGHDHDDDDDNGCNRSSEAPLAATTIMTATASLKSTTIDWSKVDNHEFVLQRFPSRRSVVYGTKGVISSSNPLATEVGLGILRQGGNAGTEVLNPYAVLPVLT